MGGSFSGEPSARAPPSPSLDRHRDVPTVAAHLVFTLCGTVDDVGGDAALGEAAVVGAVEVVVVDVLVEVALEPGEADVEVAGEGGPPAFFEDQPVQGFDVAVGLRAAGPDQSVADAELGEGGAEVGGAELAAVVAEHSFEPPACPCKSTQTRRASLEVCAPVGLLCGQLTSSAQANDEATSIAVSCQTEPFVPERRPTKKQSMPTSSPGRSASTCRSGCGSRGGSYGAA